MARKKAETLPPKDMDLTTGFPDIGEKVSEADVTTKGKDASKSMDVVLAGLSEQIGSLQEQINAGAERETRMATTVQQVLGAMPTVQQTVGLAVPEKPGLPDPVDDKDGFLKGLQTMIQETVSASVGAAGAATSMATAEQSRWSQLDAAFKTTYPEEAKMALLVTAVGSAKIAEIKARGLDSDKVVFGDPAAFMRDVAAGVKVQVEAIRGTETPEGEGEEKPAVLGPNRSNVPGAGPNPAGVVAPEEKAPDQSSMVAELKEIQRASGLF